MRIQEQKGRRQTWFCNDGKWRQEAWSRYIEMGLLILQYNLRHRKQARNSIRKSWCIMVTKVVRINGERFSLRYKALVRWDKARGKGGWGGTIVGPSLRSGTPPQYFCILECNILDIAAIHGSLSFRNRRHESESSASFQIDKKFWSFSSSSFKGSWYYCYLALVWPKKAQQHYYLIASIQVQSNRQYPHLSSTQGHLHYQVDNGHQWEWAQEDRSDWPSYCWLCPAPESMENWTLPYEKILCVSFR